MLQGCLKAMVQTVDEVNDAYYYDRDSNIGIPHRELPSMPHATKFQGR